MDFDIDKVKEEALNILHSSGKLDAVRFLRDKYDFSLLECKTMLEKWNEQIPNNIQQLSVWFTEFTKLANAFFDDNNKPLYEYWKGQVMGMTKIVELYGIKFDTTYYLNQLP